MAAAAALMIAACGTGQDGAGSSTLSAGAGDSAAEVLASIDGSEITLADLDEQVREQLARMEYQYRSQRSQLLEAAVEGVIQDRLLTEAAAARGVSLEEIVATETEGKVEVSDAEIEDWYRRNSSRLQGRQLDEVAPQIRQYLEDVERQQLVTALVSELGSEHEIDYFVEPARADFDLEGAPSFGPEDASVTLIEFSDFECPFCSSFFPTINRIKEEYGDRVRIVYLQFPLTNIHPNAFKAAEGVGPQGKGGAVGTRYGRVRLLPRLRPPSRPNPARLESGANRRDQRHAGALREWRQRARRGGAIRSGGGRDRPRAAAKRVRLGDRAKVARGLSLGGVNPFHDDRALRHEGRDRANRRPDGDEDGSDHSQSQRHLDERLPIIVLDDDAANVSLVNDLLDFGDEIIASDLMLLRADSLLLQL
jgi:thiol-disulfide isomerase/thioredoxin